MATWKKVIVSGSSAILNQVTASGGFSGDGSGITGIVGTSDNNFTTTLLNKLNAIEALADVTDATNVTAAGALMDSEVTNLADVKAFDTTDYATSAQGSTADAAMPKSGGAFTGAVTTNSTIDGVDIATRDGVLTTTTTTANAALPKTGGAMTGAITTNSTFDGRDVATDGTKLDTIETNADVTDATNVTAAGALMDSELTSIADVKALNQSLVTSASPTFATLTLSGDLIVNGDTTTLSTTNLSIEDKFITIASGSQAPADGGIIVSKQANGAGFGFGYDTGTTRWAFDNDLAVNATGIVPDAYVGTVQLHATEVPNPESAPVYGGATNGHGTIYIKKNTGDIYIYA